MSTIIPNEDDPSYMSYGDSPSQFLLFYKPNPLNENKEKHGLVIIIHGGFWKGKYGIRPPTAACESLTPDLQKLGFAVAEIEYRRSEDGQWGWPYTNQDVRTAYRVIVNNPLVDSSNVFLIGHSAGGYLALWLLANLESDDIVPKHTYSIAPIGDLRLAVIKQLSDQGDAVINFMHGPPSELQEHYNRACVTNSTSTLARRPLTIIAGGADVDVPLDIVESIYHAIQRSFNELPIQLQGDIKLKILQEADHYDLVNASASAWHEIRNDLYKKYK